MPHKRTKEVGKLLFVKNKKALRSIDRFGVNEGRRNVINQAPSVCTCRLFYAMLIPNWDKPKSVTIQHFEVNA